MTMMICSGEMMTLPTLWRMFPLPIKDSSPHLLLMMTVIDHYVTSTSIIMVVYIRTTYYYVEYIPKMSTVCSVSTALLAPWNVPFIRKKAHLDLVPNVRDPGHTTWRRDSLCMSQCTVHYCTSSIFYFWFLLPQPHFYFQEVHSYYYLNIYELLLLLQYSYPHVHFTKAAS